MMRLLPGWQCIVGTDFGSFVTHHSGCFIYFGIGNLAICPIWTPNEGPSEPSEAQRGATSGLRRLLRTARGGRGHPGEIPPLRMN